MAVLKVNVGDAVTPDWRNIGCGGAAEAYPTAANKVNVYDRGDGTLVALANQLTYSATAILDMNLDGVAFYFTFVSGSTSGHSLWSSSNDNGGGIIRGTGDSVGYSGFGFAIFCRDGSMNYLGDAFPDSAVVVASTPQGRLKLWDGTRWMREVCDDDTGTPTYTSDTFNRANSSITINPSSDGGAWTVAYGHAGIDSNQGYFHTQESLIYRDLGAAVQDITIENVRVDTAGNSGLVVNLDPVASAATSWAVLHGYVVNFDSSGSFGLANGPQAGLNAGVITGTAWTGAGSSTIRIVSDGAGNIDLYQDGVLLASIAPNEPSFTTLTGTCIALWTNFNGRDSDHWDNYSGTAVPPLERHPLKVNVGTPSVPDWQTAACMTPA